MSRLERIRKADFYQICNLIHKHDKPTLGKLTKDLPASEICKDCEFCPFESCVIDQLSLENNNTIYA